jgi:dTDP-4-amino-4,6-dideoxygalactose transaminase
LARAAVAQRYADALPGLVGVPRARDDIEPAWSYYTIEAARRDALAKRLAAHGIACAVYYRKPLHRQLAYASFPSAPGLQVAERLAERVNSLPIHADLEQSDQARIIDAICALVAEKGA